MQRFAHPENGRTAGGPSGKKETYPPMLSLDAVRKQAQVAKFHDTMADHISSEKDWYVLEPKFDGLSVEVVYRDGSLEFPYFHSVIKKSRT